MKWNRWAFVAIFLLTACQPAVEESPALLTEVHLQAKFALPDLLEGVEPSHDEMEYLLYLPKGYGEDPDKKWPMIFFLHGSGNGEYDSQFVMSSGLPEVLYSGDQPDPFPFIVISPQAYENTPWWVGDTLQILNALLDEVINTYQVDADRVYLTGLSMGGYGTWFMATNYPDRFAATASISGSGYRTAYLPEAEYLCQMEDIPLWAFHGAQDQISIPEASKMFIDAFETECNSDVKWTLYPDVGHMGAFVRAYRDPELYEWMLSHSRGN